MAALTCITWKLASAAGGSLADGSEPVQRSVPFRACRGSVPAVLLPLMLLLASASPARRRLLEQAAIPHRVMVSGFDEEAVAEPDPTQLVLRLAEAKAQAVAERAGPQLLASDGTTCEALLACDSVLRFQGEVFGKPRTSEEAQERWMRMRGQWAELLTGHCCLLPPQPVSASAWRQRSEVVTTRLRFAALTDAMVERYVASGEPLACAGGFALEGRGGVLVERIEGCWSNVIGLSLPLLHRWLSAIERG